MKRTALLAFIALLLTAAAAPAPAETIYPCPDLTTAEKVGTCPSPDDLKRYFHSNCPRDPDGAPPHCASLAAFSKTKNITMWGVRSAGEEFLTYFNCETDTDRLRGSKVQAMEMVCGERKGCHVNCAYENGYEVTLRLRTACAPVAGGRADGGRADGPDGRPAKVDCRDDPAACAVRCIDGP